MGRWEAEHDTPPMPTSAGVFRDLFGFRKWQDSAPRAEAQIGRQPHLAKTAP